MVYIQTDPDDINGFKCWTIYYGSPRNDRIVPCTVVALYSVNEEEYDVVLKERTGDPIMVLRSVSHLFYTRKEGQMYLRREQGRRPL